MASDQDVQEARERVAKKREDLRKRQSKATENVHEVSNDLALNQLSAEEARLDRALAQVRQNKGDLKDSSSEAFETAKTQEQAAKAAAKAQGQGE